MTRTDDSLFSVVLYVFRDGNSSNIISSVCGSYNVNTILYKLRYPLFFSSHFLTLTSLLFHPTLKFISLVPSETTLL